MGYPPPTIFPIRKLDEWAFYTVKNFGRSFFPLITQFTRLTDRQTDGNLVANAGLHSMQRGKKQNNLTCFC